jgi:hypothetical protein
MYLLKKDTFTFDKILMSGYEIDEQPNLISKKQFVNGKRKKIVTDYVDCIITISLGGLDITDINSYLEALEDGEFEYYSIAGQEYRSANFIASKPVLVVNSAYSENEQYYEDLTVILEKSSDVEVVSI